MNLQTTWENMSWWKSAQQGLWHSSSKKASGVWRMERWAGQLVFILQRWDFLVLMVGKLVCGLKRDH